MPSLTERIPPRALDTLTWRQLGPWRGGRATAVAGHPRTPDTFYFGASGGGVWRTDNAGATWRCLSDGQFARGSVGALAVAPSEPGTLYVGMGECSLRGNVTGGDGVYVSHDGGTTWAHRGLTATQNIARIAVHPQDAERVWVAAFGHRFGPNTERGVYRSDDGGATWARILFRDAQTGAIDLALDPANPRILYAALWQACRTPWGFTSGGPGSGIFKSVDGGDTWTEITRRPGLPAGLLGRVGLSVSPANPRRVWALIEADGATGVYRSDDRGETWTWASDEPNLAVRPWYFGQIVADPRDADTVYVPHRKLWQSVDGGRSFRQMNMTYWDQHALWLDPDDPRRMILGNDGGAAVSRDSGATWSTILNQPTAELYHVATDTRFPYRIYGAQQDTSTISLPIRSDRGPISQADWRDVGGGESGHIAVRPDNPEIVYAASYAGEITRYDHRTGDLRTISVWPEASDGWGARDVRHRFNWSTPVALSPHDPNTLYVAGERVFRSTDEGQSWEAISPDLTRADPATLAPAGGPITYDSSGADYYGTILTFAESPLSRGTLWAGSDDGLLHISRDNGATWADVTPPGLPQWANICTIEPSPHAAGTAYVAASNHKRDDFRPLLYKTSDGGATWAEITAGISPDEFARVIRADPARPGLLYVGTEAGVWVSLDDGAAWRPLQQNLPAVSIYDLAVKKGDLIAATHGRGFWALDDLSPLHQLTTDVLDAQVHLLAPRPTYRVAREAYGITSLISMSYNFGAENPPSGVVFAYYLREQPTDTMTLTILDKGGAEIARFSSASPPPPAEPLGPYAYRLRGSSSVLARKSTGDDEPGVRVGVLPPEMQGRATDAARLPNESGVNRFVWDMKYPGARGVPGYQLGGITAPLALPGAYLARLAIGAQEWTTPFQIVRDLRTVASDADLTAQFTLARYIRDATSAAHDTVNALRDVRGQLELRVRSLHDDPATVEIRQSVAAIIAQLGAIEGVLIQPRLHERAGEQESLNSPIALDAKLATLGYWVARCDDAPTTAQTALFRDLAARVDEQVARLRTIIATDLAALNAAMAASHVPAVVLPPAL